MWWHEQTWQTLAQMDKNTPVVIPTGSCEQHGHHLPVFVDTIQVTAIAEKAQAMLGDEALVLPTMWLGSSHHHIDFAGTVSAKPSLYSEIIKTMALSVLRAGFRKIMFLNGHGGNAVPGQQALTELVAENDDANDAWLIWGNWWHVSKKRLTSDEVGLESDFITHACEYETSLMLFVRPDLVHQDKAVDGKPVLDSEWSTFEAGGPVSVFRRWNYITAEGSMGLPSKATAAKGEAMLKVASEEVASFVRDFKTWQNLEPIGPK